MPPRRPRGQIAGKKGRYGQGGPGHPHHCQWRNGRAGGNGTAPAPAAAPRPTARQPTAGRAATRRRPNQPCSTARGPFPPAPRCGAWHGNKASICERSPAAENMAASPRKIFRPLPAGPSAGFHAVAAPGRSGLPGRPSAARCRRPVRSSAVPPGESGTDAWGPVRVEKISRIRRTIAEQMARSAATIPHVTNFDDADVTELERLRQGVPAAS